MRINYISFPSLLSTGYLQLIRVHWEPFKSRLQFIIESMTSSLLRSCRLKLLALGLAILGAATAHEYNNTLLPKPPGKFKVGTTSFELVDYGRSDPLAPSPQPRDLMIQVFYPAHRVQNYPLASEFTPALAQYYTESIPFLSKEALLSVKTRAHTGAPFLNVKSPVLIFSPGYTAFSRAYSGLASFLASEGYVIVAIDHPYHNSVVEYPDGRAVIHKTANSTADATFLGLEVRRQDVSFVIDRLTNGSLNGLIPGCKGGLEMSKVGIYGHSYGGATATSALLKDTRVACAGNLDGFIAPPDAAQGADGPFLLMTAAIYNNTLLTEWNQFISNSRGFKRHLSVENTQHMSYSDAPAILDILGIKNATAREEIAAGTISGPRSLEVQSAYLDAFFSKCLRGTNEPLLSGPSRRYRDVQFLQ